MDDPNVAATGTTGDVVKGALALALAMVTGVLVRLFSGRPSEPPKPPERLSLAPAVTHEDLAAMRARIDEVTRELDERMDQIESAASGRNQREEQHYAELLGHVQYIRGRFASFDEGGGPGSRSRR